MYTHDEIVASTIETDDLVMVGNDPIEVTEVKDLTDAIKVKGVSYNTGDTVEYFLDPFAFVYLWTE